MWSLNAHIFSKPLLVSLKIPNGPITIPKEITLIDSIETNIKRRLHYIAMVDQSAINLHLLFKEYDCKGHV